MATYKNFPDLTCIINRGQDAAISLYSRDCDGSDRDWTGAVMTDVVTFYPSVGSSWTATPTLDADPTAVPQASVKIADTDTSGLTDPQRIIAVWDVTLQSGDHDVGKFWFKLGRTAISAT